MKAGREEPRKNIIAYAMSKRYTVEVIKKASNTPSNATRSKPCEKARNEHDTQSTSRHLDVLGETLSQHLSLHQVSPGLRLSLLFGVDDVDDSVVRRATRSVARRSVAPSGRALDLGRFWWLGRLHATNHGEWVLKRPADDHGPEALAGQVIVHVLYCVGHVQGVLASAFGAGVL